MTSPMRLGDGSKRDSSLQHRETHYNHRLDLQKGVLDYGRSHIKHSRP